MTSDDSDSLFTSFYNEVKEIEKKDSVLTSKQQIDRLLRKGSTFFNLNPFEVLQIDPDTIIDDARKQYRKLSILVHPDKNQEDKERAQKAFDILKKAIETIEDPERLLRCKEIIIEARARTDQAIQEKRKQLKKIQKAAPIVEEDDPNKYNRALWVTTMKLFAERERKRKMIEDRDQEDKKRQRQEQTELDEKKKIEDEFNKNFEESRDERVTSWKFFQNKKEKKGKFSKGSFRPPKPKPEQRKETKNS